VQPNAFFLPAKSPATGQRFCLHYPAQGDVRRGQVIYIHPFAEEMNKARRMAALQARALAQAGFSVLQIDLLGCGDSSGDFGDATWESWVNDVVQACHWLRSQTHPGDKKEVPPLWLWGLRAGCLVAVDAAAQLNEPCHFLFWQPPAAGKPLLQQFLRLKVAADMLGGQSKGVMEAMRQELANGSPVEVAGYMVSASLATGLDRAKLALPVAPPGSQASQVEWFEVSTRDDASLSPVSTQTVASWQMAGIAVNSHVVKGPSFWQTTEIEDAPALIEATTAALIKAAA
jgi:exosortase A-associated hydrolase 2